MCPLEVIHDVGKARFNLIVKGRESFQNKEGIKIKSTNRLLALDVFRGMTIASMIIVNIPGSWSYVYAPLRHAKWHGCTPTDFIFPFFLFIVGVAMSYSLKAFENKISLSATKKILKRVFIIFSIGLILNAFPFNEGFTHLRILGVLQRIAIAYGIASFFCLYLNSRKLIILSAIILLSYWLLIFLFGQGNPYALDSNLVRVIDLKLIGEKHLWTGTGIPFDPEGLLSTLPSVVTVIFGYLTGQQIRSKAVLKQTTYRLFLTGLAAIVTGKIWGIFFPINKSLWTSSFVLYTSGWALIFLTVLLWIIDIKGYKKWTFPFIVFGTNSLFVYVLSSIWVKIYIYLIKIPKADGSVTNAYDWIYHSIFEPMAGHMNGSLLFAIAHVFVFWLILLFMYRRKIFIKI